MLPSTQRKLSKIKLKSFNTDRETVDTIDAVSDVFKSCDIGGGILGYMFEASEDRLIVFGFANYTLGYSASKPDGINIENNDMENKNPTVKEMIEYMKKVLDRYNVEYKSIEQKGGTKP